MSEWDAPLEYIEKGRWNKNSLEGSTPKGEKTFCALGMIGAALWGERWLEGRRYLEYIGYTSLRRSSRGRRMVAALNEVIKEQFPERVGGSWLGDDPIDSVVAFNDNKETTEEDLRLVFEKASLK